MACQQYSKDDLTQVLCNAFKSFLSISGSTENQTAGFLEGLLNPRRDLGLEISVHCLCVTDEELVIDLKLSDIHHGTIDLFKAICESVEADANQPSVTFGVYVRVDCN